MFFFVIGEPSYMASSWYKHILSGIFNEKRSKRFNTVIIDSIDDIYNFPKGEDDVILIIGSGASWLESIIDICEDRFGKNVIVLGNFERPLGGRSYSIVSSDIAKDLRNLYSYLVTYGKHRIALYGINPHSASDDFRRNSYLECGGLHDDIYVNDCELALCFERFEERAGEYDAVLCANDYCAISLVRHLKERGIPLPYIASCGETRLARIFTPSITNLKTNYSDFGRAGVNVYKMLQKDINISSLNIRLVSNIIPGDTTENLEPEDNAKVIIPKTEHIDDSFYSDVEIAEMLSIENVLNACDRSEFEMLSLLISGMTYSDIAEKCHMSVNGVKYKIKKLFELGGVSSKSEFLKLTKSYMEQ